jgi:predicted SpoU family rRNA methylase
MTKQIELEVKGKGVERPLIKAIEKAADVYVEIRNKRMALTEKEVAARAVLINAMHENECALYLYDDLKIELIAKERVKVVSTNEDYDDTAE